MEGIVKVWLQLAADGDESYTSLPCAAATLGWQLGEKLTASVKKRSGLSIDLGDPTRHQRSSDAGQPLWHVVLKASGAPLKLHEPVLPQLEAAGEKELRLLHAPPPLPTVAEIAPLPSYPVGRCVHASATWSPSQALVSYLACSGLLPVAHAEALSKRCMEEGVVGLDECVNGLLDSIGDLDELRDSQGAEAHDQLIACLRSIQSGSVPDALQERLRPVRRNNGRIRSIIVRDTHHIVATIHATPMISPALAAATAASSPAAATSPATSSAATAAPSSTAGSSPPPLPHLLCPANASPPPPVPAPPAAAALAEVGEEGEEDEVDADAEFDMALAAQTRVRCSTSAAPLPAGFRGSIVSPTSLTRNPSPALPATATATTPTAGAATATTPKHQSKVSALAAAFSMVDVSAATATPAATPAAAAASAGPAPTVSPPPASGTATPTAAALASAPARRPPAAPANGGSTSTTAAAAASPSLDALSPSRSSSIAKPANVELVVDSGVLVERAVDWPTVQFDVTKVNERGRRQPRSLRLTSTHIQNVKSHSNISSRHAYDEVWCVTLADQETLVISYRDSHDYTYISPIAGEIAAEIQGRMTSRREKMKHNLATNLHVMAIKFQEKIHRREQKRIGNAGNGAGGGAAAAAGGAVTSEGQQSFLHSSAAAVVESSLGALETTTAAAAAAAATAAAPAPAPSSSPSLPSPTAAAAAAAAAGPRSSIIGAGSALSPRSGGIGGIGSGSSSSSKSAQKLQQLFGSTHSQRLQQAIESHILESSSDGGRARARFLRNMPALEKNPATMLAIVRQFLDSLRAFVENKRGEELRKTMGVGAGSTGPIPGEEELDLPARIERAVQGAVVQPAYTRIIATLRRLCAPADEAIALALTKLRAQIGPDQSYYGVPASSHNVHNWQAAIEELNDVDRALLPLDKLKALLHCARAIYSTFNADRTTRNKLAGHPPQLGQYFLSADDFFPIFVFVVANSSLQHLDTTRTFMWGLCDRASLNGEGGYYLTVFEAACEFIRNQPAILEARVTTK